MKGKLFKASEDATRATSKFYRLLDDYLNKGKESIMEWVVPSIRDEIGVDDKFRQPGLPAYFLSKFYGIYWVNKLGLLIELQPLPQIRKPKESERKNGNTTVLYNFYKVVKNPRKLAYPSLIGAISEGAPELLNSPRLKFYLAMAVLWDSNHAFIPPPYYIEVKEAEQMSRAVRSFSPKMILEPEITPESELGIASAQAANGAKCFSQFLQNFELKEFFSGQQSRSHVERFYLDLLEKYERATNKRIFLEEQINKPFPSVFDRDGLSIKTVKRRGREGKPIEIYESRKKYPYPDIETVKTWIKKGRKIRASRQLPLSTEDPRYINKHSVESVLYAITDPDEADRIIEDWQDRGSNYIDLNNKVRSMLNRKIKNGLNVQKLYLAEVSAELNIKRTLKKKAETIND